MHLEFLFQLTTRGHGTFETRNLGACGNVAPFVLSLFENSESYSRHTYILDRTITRTFVLSFICSRKERNCVDFVKFRHIDVSRTHSEGRNWKEIPKRKWNETVRGQKEEREVELLGSLSIISTETLIHLYPF